MKSFVVDAGVVIGFANAADAHHRDAVESVRKAVEDGAALFISAVSVAEIMVGPLKMGAQATSDSLELLKDMFDNRVVPVDRHSAVAIARARVEHPDLRLPDAAVVAAADIVGADAILTTDDDFDGVDAAVRLDRFLS